MPQYLVRGFDRESGQQIDRKVAAVSPMVSGAVAVVVVGVVVIRCPQGSG